MAIINTVLNSKYDICLLYNDNSYSRKSEITQNATATRIFNEDMSDFAYYCSRLVFNMQTIPIEAWKNVTNMYRSFFICQNLTGSPVCGDKVTNLCNAYTNCYNLTGSPACGDNVTNMYNAYAYCYNLNGSPVCGPNVNNMGQTYYSCYRLTGQPVCGPNVTYMSYAYYNCPNLCGNMFMQSDNVAIASYMLSSHNGATRLNIWVRNGTTTNSTLYSNYIAGYVSWTRDNNNFMYYNKYYNLYVHYNWNGVIW